MNKKKIVNCVKIVVVIGVILCIVLGLFLNFVGYNIGKNIQFSVSDKIVKTDLENQNVYARAYEQYELKDEYEYYTCIIKIENNSKKNIANVEFREIKKKNFRIDYENQMFAPLFVESNSVGYVPCIISVKKGISDEELKKIPYQLPSKIKISFANDVNDLNYSSKKYMNYSVVTDDYSKHKLILHTEPI